MLVDGSDDATVLAARTADTTTVTMLAIPTLHDIAIRTGPERGDAGEVATERGWWTIHQ